MSQNRTREQQIAELAGCAEDAGMRSAPAAEYAKEHAEEFEKRVRSECVEELGALLKIAMPLGVKPSVITDRTDPATGDVVRELRFTPRDVEAARPATPDEDNGISREDQIRAMTSWLTTELRSVAGIRAYLEINLPIAERRGYRDGILACLAWHMLKDDTQ